jgi:hypothetical protein
MPRLEDFERFGDLDPEWRKAYLKRPLDRLPQDLTAACDEIRRQRKEINNVRGQLFETKKENKIISAKYGVATGILGGLAFKGLSVVLTHFLK